MHTTTFPETAKAIGLDADRLSVAASVLCAIHCAGAPILLIALPAFGSMWAHPATHWGMALLVVPVAAVMTYRGFRRHGRRRVVAFAAYGILLVIAGGLLPYLEFGKDPANGFFVPIPGADAQPAPSSTDTCCPPPPLSPARPSSTSRPLPSSPPSAAWPSSSPTSGTSAPAGLAELAEATDMPVFQLL